MFDEHNGIGNMRSTTFALWQNRISSIEHIEKLLRFGKTEHFWILFAGKSHLLDSLQAKRTNAFRSGKIMLCIAAVLDLFELGHDCGACHIALQYRTRLSHTHTHTHAGYAHTSTAQTFEIETSSVSGRLLISELEWAFWRICSVPEDGCVSYYGRGLLLVGVKYSVPALIRHRQTLITYIMLNIVRSESHGESLSCGKREAGSGMPIGLYDHTDDVAVPRSCWGIHADFIYNADFVSRLHHIWCIIIIW